MSETHGCSKKLPEQETGYREDHQQPNVVSESTDRRDTDNELTGPEVQQAVALSEVPEVSKYTSQLEEPGKDQQDSGLTATGAAIDNVELQKLDKHKEETQWVPKSSNTSVNTASQGSKRKRVRRRYDSDPGPCKRKRGRPPKEPKQIRRVVEGSELVSSGRHVYQVKGNERPRPK